MAFLGPEMVKSRKGVIILYHPSILEHSSTTMWEGGIVLNVRPLLSLVTKEENLKRIKKRLRSHPIPGCTFRIEGMEKSSYLPIHSLPKREKELILR